MALEELDREIGGTEVRGQLRGFGDRARQDAAKSELVELNAKWPFASLRLKMS